LNEQHVWELGPEIDVGGRHVVDRDVALKLGYVVQKVLLIVGRLSKPEAELLRELLLLGQFHYLIDLKECSVA
jgi:hypothetical protein